MSLLKHIPSEKELSRLYWELSGIGAPSVGKKNPWSYAPRSSEELILLACEMCRYDPRLLTILVYFFIKHWQKLNPVSLRIFSKEMAFPQVLGVVGEFVCHSFRNHKEVRYFFEYLMKDLKPVIPQLFFIGLFSIGSELDRKTSMQSLREYKKWGFLGSERPTIDLATKKTGGGYDIETRRLILGRLLERRESIALKDYLEAVESSISRQQALYDLKGYTAIKPVGRGRGARWILRKKVAQ